MSIHLQSSALALILLLTAVTTAQAEDSNQKQSSGRRIAMALPKITQQGAALKAVNPTPLANSGVTAKVETSSEPAKRSNFSKPDKSKQIPENVKAVLIDGADKAEKLSRSYNRRIADLIVWIASSWNKPSSLTPVEGPYFRPQHIVTPQSVPHNEHNSVFQID